MGQKQNGSNESATHEKSIFFGISNNNDNDNDTLREGQPTSVRNLALRT